MSGENAETDWPLRTCLTESSRGVKYGSRGWLTEADDDLLPDIRIYRDIVTVRILLAVVASDDYLCPLSSVEIMRRCTYQSLILIRVFHLPPPYSSSSSSRTIAGIYRHHYAGFTWTNPNDVGDLAGETLFNQLQRVLTAICVDSCYLNAVKAARYVTL